MHRNRFVKSIIFILAVINIKFKLIFLSRTLHKEINRYKNDIVYF